MLKSRKSRLAAAVASIVLLAAAFGIWKVFSHPRARSFVLVVVDTLRADHLGLYGSDRNLTPSLDALAEESHVFENAIATSAWTRSSIASMFTSRFPGPLGVLGRKDVLPDGMTTLAKIFQQHGYATHGITTNGNIGASLGFGQGFDEFVYPHELRSSYRGDSTRFPAEEVTGKALDWLEQRDTSKPFFLFILYTDPHDPYGPHEGILPEAEPPGRFKGSRLQLRRLDEAYRRRRLPQADMDRIKYLYAGEVKYCDRWIGKLIDGLKNADVWDELMFAVTADHGEGLWDHGRRGHGHDLYEELIRIPLLVRYPNKIYRRSSRVAEPVSLIDLAPTFLAAAGIDRPPSFRGYDLWPLMEGKERIPDRPGIYSELGLDGIHLESIRIGSQKLIRDRSLSADDLRAYQLFDLSLDPEEKYDLMEEREQSAAQLIAALFGWRTALAQHPQEAHQETSLDRLSPADLESMKALGYLDQEEYDAAVRARVEKEKRAP